MISARLTGSKREVHQWRAKMTRTVAVGGQARRLHTFALIVSSIGVFEVMLANVRTLLARSRRAGANMWRNLGGLGTGFLDRTLQIIDDECAPSLTRGCLGYVAIISSVFGVASRLCCGSGA